MVTYHGTRLEFPKNVAGTLMHLFDLFFRCTKSSTILGGLILYTKVIRKIRRCFQNVRKLLEAVKNCVCTCMRVYARFVFPATF